MQYSMPMLSYYRFHTQNIVLFTPNLPHVKFDLNRCFGGMNASKHHSKSFGALRKQSITDKIAVYYLTRGPLVPYRSPEC